MARRGIARRGVAMASGTGRFSTFDEGRGICSRSRHDTIVKVHSFVDSRSLAATFAVCRLMRRGRMTVVHGTCLKHEGGAFCSFDPDGSFPVFFRPSWRPCAELESEPGRDGTDGVSAGLLAVTRGDASHIRELFDAVVLPGPNGDDPELYNRCCVRLERGTIAVLPPLRKTRGGVSWNVWNEDP